MRASALEADYSPKEERSISKIRTNNVTADKAVGLYEGAPHTNKNASHSTR